MKYAIVILGGAADVPQGELDGRTPLEAAPTPNIDQLAEAGRVGQVTLTPDGMPCTDDVTLLSLVGVDPLRYGGGPAILEAQAAGVTIPERGWAARLNLVTVSDERLLDHTAGRLGDAEGIALLNALAEALRDQDDQALRSLFIKPLSGHRGVLLDTAGSVLPGLTTTPPPERIMPGSAARMQTRVPFRFVTITSASSASGWSKKN